MIFPRRLFNPSSRILRQIATIWLLLFLAISWLELTYKHNCIGFAFVAIALIGLIGLLKPFVIRWLLICVATIGYPLGCLVGQFMLVIAFFLVLTPIALILRLCRRDQLLLRPDSNQTTFWVNLTKSQTRKKW